jgi:hypothetical protein
MTTTLTDPMMIATHWVNGCDMSPMYCLQTILTDPAVKTEGGYTKLVGTPLEIPALWATKLDLVNVGVALVGMCTPVESGVALVMARRKGTKTSASIWEAIAHHSTMAPSVSMALATSRSDIQLFVAKTWRAVTLAAGPACTAWIEAALDGVWDVVTGSACASHIRDAMATMEIVCVPSRHASLAFYDDAGVAILDGDRCLILLYLLFAEPRYLTSLPPFTPHQITTAASAPWLGLITFP